MRSGSPRTTVGSSSRAERRRRRRCGSRARCDQDGDDPVDADVVEHPPGLAAAGELDHVADERGQLVELGEDVGAQRGALVLRAGARTSSSVWMLARRLAIGVRSSWLASATRWRCASTERSSASRVALKLRASRASSSSPVAAIRSTGIGVAGDLLGPAGEARDRGERRAGDERAEAGGERDPGRGDDREDDEDVAQRVVDLGQRPRDLHRAPRPRRARAVKHAHVGARDVACWRANSPVPVARDRSRPRGHGQRRGRARRAQHRPVRADDLRVALGPAEARVVAIGRRWERPVVVARTDPAGVVAGVAGQLAARARAGRRRSARAAAPGPRGRSPRPRSGR